MWAVFEWFTSCTRRVAVAVASRSVAGCIPCGDVMVVVIVMIYIVLYCIHMVNVGWW